MSEIEIIGKQKPASARGLSAKTQRSVYGRALGRCEFRDDEGIRCGAWLVRTVDSMGTLHDGGEIAHIYGLRPGSARYSADLPGNPNKPWNLLLLCREHHRLIDDRQLTHMYPPELLVRWRDAGLLGYWRADAWDQVKDTSLPMEDRVMAALPFSREATEKQFYAGQAWQSDIGFPPTGERFFPGVGWLPVDLPQAYYEIHPDRRSRSRVDLYLRQSWLLRPPFVGDPEQAGAMLDAWTGHDPIADQLCALLPTQHNHR